MCHEFAHVLTLHDMYDKDYEENGQAPGFGSWSLMGTGNQLNDGRTPPNLTAFERQQLGWGTVTELKTADTYSLRDISTGDIYRINTPLANEYFLLENRQLSGWDEYLPGSGMLITRVYADEDLFNNNEVNNVEGRERVNLLEANGVYWYSGYRSASSDAFPGSAGITEFNDVLKDPVRLSNLPGSFQGTAANSLLWNGQALGKPIVNIREIGGEIWFDFFEAQNPYSIYSAGNTLVIDSKINLKQILVYNPLGQLIRNIPGQRGENTLELATGQVYILKLNDEVRKIVM
jgi:hypothetical protein